MASYSNPTPDTHLEVLYRQTYNTLGAITTAGLTQDNRVGNTQKVANTRLSASTPKGILAGSVVAVVGEGQIGPCAGDSTTAFDMAVGIAVNNALGNPYESSSAVASNKVVYAHGTGTVIRTDLYEVVLSDGSTPITYAYGDKMYSSKNGLLTNEADIDASSLSQVGTSPKATLMGILLQKPTATDLYMTVQLRV
jgi:hypothetical protein